MILIYSIAFIISLLYQYKRKGFNCVTFLLAIYTVSAICSFIYVRTDVYVKESLINFEAIVYHLLCLWLWFYPVCKVFNKGLSRFCFLPEFQMRILSYIIVCVSIICIMVTIGQAISLFSLGNIHDARKLVYEDQLEAANYGIFSFFANLAPTVAILSAFFLFYFIAYNPKKKWLLILLFISTFAVVSHNLATMGRDGFVRWFFNIVFSYFYFKNTIQDDVKKVVIKVMSLALVLVLGGLTIVTIGRFDDGFDGTIDSVISYIGQCFVYFSYGYELFEDGTYGGRITFPVFFPGEQISLAGLNNSINASYSLNTFSTFIGTIYIDLGRYKTFLISLILFGINICMFNRRRLNMSLLIYSLFLYQIISTGLFYYFYAQSSHLKMMFLIIVITMFFEIKNRRKCNMTRNGNIESRILIR